MGPSLRFTFLVRALSFVPCLATPENPTMQVTLEIRLKSLGSGILSWKCRTKFKG